MLADPPGSKEAAIETALRTRPDPQEWSITRVASDWKVSAVEVAIKRPNVYYFTNANFRGGSFEATRSCEPDAALGTRTEPLASWLFADASL